MIYHSFSLTRQPCSWFKDLTWLNYILTYTQIKTIFYIFFNIEKVLFATTKHKQNKLLRINTLYIYLKLFKTLFFVIKRAWCSFIFIIIFFYLSLVTFYRQMAVIGLNIVCWGGNYRKYMNSIERILEIVVIKCVKTHHMHSISRTSPLINTTRASFKSST